MAPVAPDRHLGFVPDVIAARIGNSVGVAAIDMRAFKGDQLLALIPAPYACARDLVKYLGVAVLAVDDRDRVTMYATQLSETNTKICLEQIAHAAGVSTSKQPDGSFDFDALRLHWDAGVLSVHELGNELPAPAPPDAELLELMSHVPAQAPLFLLVKRTTTGKPLRLTAWAQVDGGKLIAMATAEGTSPGDAHDWVVDVVQGFKDGAKQQHAAVDDAWFKVTDDGLASTVEARIPLSAISAAWARAR